MLRKISMLSLLCAGIFLSGAAYAEITTEYLDTLTSPSVKWVPEAEADGLVTIEEKKFGYTYSKPDDYTETTSRVDSLTADNVTKKVFKDITTTDNGGAISNKRANANLEINADFINNSAAMGGAIYNEEALKSISGNFINNSASKQNGGAIYNDWKVDNISGNFIGNHITNDKTDNTSYIYGGVINNTAYGVIGKSNGDGTYSGGIEGNFIGNYLESRGETHGGVIYNDAAFGTGTIRHIKGNFIGNYLNSSHDFAWGVVIENLGTIESIDGTFIDNHAFSGGSSGDSANHGALGGVLRNAKGAKILDIKGTYTGNYVHGQNIASGGVIQNLGEIASISGVFKDNHVIVDNENRQLLLGGSGGVITNNGGTIKSIKDSTFENNSASYGGVLFLIHPSDTSVAPLDLSNNTYKNNKGFEGGAIYNKETIQIANSSFEGNEAGMAGGAILNTGSGLIKSISNSRFYQNKATTGGAIHSFAAGAIEKIEGSTFEGNEAKEANGGAIFWNAPYNNPMQITNTIFKSNTAAGKGGAIASFRSNIILKADNGTVEFSDNKANGVSNAIYMDANENDTKISQLNLIASNNGKILFNDGINGLSYGILISGDADSEVVFNEQINNAKSISLTDTNMVVSKGEYLQGNESLTISSGHMTIKDLGLTDLHFKSFGMPSGLLTIASVDVDLANQTSGQISADEVALIAGRAASTEKGKIEVENIRLLSDGEAGDTKVQFVSDDIAKEVTTEIKEAVAPVYKYGVSYDAATGEFTFTRGDEVNSVKPEPAPDIFNQGVFASDVFMMSSLNMQNSAVKEVASMDPNKEPCMGRVWALPFYSDDTIEYKNFYDVNSRNYGLIAGVDTRVFGNSDLSHVYTLFGAYSEGKDKYEGIKVENKSWLLGLKASMFSDNGLYGDAIVDIASHDMDADTFYGSDSHDTYGYGAALKGGYKHDIEKVNIDTSVMLSWQQIKGDDFTAKSGAKMKTDDYSRLSLMPQVKVGYDLTKVRPYALVRYNFVLDEDGSSVANETTLPEIESKDYVEYGLGVETTTNSNHSGFAHVLRHDGGREGWAITAGYRYNF